jgi:hypothetical protein
VLCLCPEQLTIEEQKEVRDQLGSRRIAFTVLPACDSPSYNILSEHLREAEQVALAAREVSGAVLVQCWGGCNRAPTVGTALLMCLERRPLVDACGAVQAVRGEILTNQSFRRQLLQLAVEEGLLEEETLPAQLPCDRGRSYRWDTDVVEEFLHLLHVSIVTGDRLSYRDSTGKSFGQHLADMAWKPGLRHRHTTLVRRWVLAKLLLSELE